MFGWFRVGLMVVGATTLYQAARSTPAGEAATDAVAALLQAAAAGLGGA